MVTPEAMGALFGCVTSAAYGPRSEK